MGSTSSSRMDDSESRSRSDDGDDAGSDQETDLATILQYLIRSGQVQIISSNYEEELYLGPRLPKLKGKPCTDMLDKSAFALETRLSSGCSLTENLNSKSPNVTSMVLQRERGGFVNRNFSNGSRCQLANRYLPNEMTLLAHYGAKAFCGTYSPDGNYFISASQDRQIRVFKTDGGKLLLNNLIQARDVGWSVIDVAFSPNCKSFAYSSWSTSLHVCSLNEGNETQEALSLSPTERRFCIFSLVYSGDGRELVGGANDGFLYVYDLGAGRRSLRINAHDYDVNTVAFADGTSNILYSGGDDGLAKVWDRRTLNESSPKPVGCLAGHMDGITFIDSRGDGRHLISNSKDQSIKLWDVRRFSGGEGQQQTLKAVNDQTWDYRWQAVPRRLYNPRHRLAGDTSVMTYRGHSVLKTLVRCRFSPRHSTGQRYIYTGCGVGRLVVYDALTGRVRRDLSGHNACVRDVSWHPYRPEIVSSSWDGTLGLWTYSPHPNVPDAESTEETGAAAAATGSSSDVARRRCPMILRRSKRIALRRERERERRGRDEDNADGEPDSAVND